MYFRLKMNQNSKILFCEEIPDYSLLPNETLLRIFKFLKNDDLFQMQQVCSKFKILVENELNNEIKTDWRLEYLKFQKFKTEISSSGAIKEFENAKNKNGKCSVKVTNKYHNSQVPFTMRQINGFNEVRKINI
jgi:hypothetical protein